MSTVVVVSLSQSAQCRSTVVFSHKIVSFVSRFSFYWWVYVACCCSLDDCSLEQVFRDNRIPEMHYELSIQNYEVNRRTGRRNAFRVTHLGADDMPLIKGHCFTMLLSALVCFRLFINVVRRLRDRHQNHSVHAAVLWVGAAAAVDKKFLLLYKELDPDDEEMTRTKKIRRKFINQKYTEEIAALYGDVAELPIETVIRYQDGKTATLRTNLIMRAMKPESAYQSLLKKKGFWAQLKGGI